MKIVIIGATHAGTTAALHLKQCDPQFEIILIERNNYIQFMRYGIAMSLQSGIPLEKMFLHQPSDFTKLGIEILLEHTATDIDFKKKQVTVQSAENEIKQLIYDKLIIATGSQPIVPKYAENFNHLNNVFQVKSYQNGLKLQEYFKQNKNQDKVVAIIGGGYTAIELLQSFAQNNFKVVIVDRNPRVLRKYFDQDICEIVEEIIRPKCTLALNSEVKSLQQIQSKLHLNVFNNKTQEYQLITADACVICIGDKPSTNFLVQAAQRDGLELETILDAIKIDQNSRTSIPDVYACGGCAITRFHGEQIFLPLAQDAVRQGISAAFDIINQTNAKIPQLPTFDSEVTMAVRVYDKVLSQSGLSTAHAQQLFGADNIKSHTVKQLQKLDFMTINESVLVKIVYRNDTKQLVGAQVVGDRNSVEVSQIASIMINRGMDLKQVVQQDFAFNQWFGKPQHVLQQAALEVILQEGFK
ncbi:NADH_oxidase [Hexamita inflata]|uniref:NADH_oxidase n=1 Tax=Hexamita inflata TaxID=28002 RepID=A0ABP1HUH7_9EUKA